MSSSAFFPRPPAAVLASLTECHQDIERHLVRLRALVTALSHAGLTDTVRAEAQAALTWFGETAHRHHLAEERHVLPALLASGDAGLAQYAQRLSDDHGCLETEWEQLAPALQAVAGGLASFDPHVLRHGVEVFVQMYRDHMAIEEAKAYPPLLR